MKDKKDETSLQVSVATLPCYAAAQYMSALGLEQFFFGRWGSLSIHVRYGPPPSLGFP